MPLPPEDARVLDFAAAHPHARAQFDFFRAMNHPHFGLVATVDVAPLWAFAKTHNAPFNRLVTHAVSTAANAVPALRRRIRGEGADALVVEHARVHPSYAVDTDASAGFSFCEVGFRESWPAYSEAAAAVENAMRAAPSMADAPGRDDYLFLSAIPWVHFTGIQHAMHYHPHDSVPRISWGKVLPRGEQLVMPVSIQAHHALMDGRGLGDFYAALEAYVAGVS